MPPSLQKVHISGRASNELLAAAQQVYQQANAQLVNSKEAAGLVIDIIHEDYSRRTLSLGTEGYSNEYALIYRVHFNLLAKQGRVLASHQQLEVRKSYFNEQTSDSLSAKQKEEQRLRSSLYQEAVRRITQRAKALVKP